MPLDNVELGTLPSFVEREAYSPTLNDDKLPENFPLEQWTTQSARYADNWKWYSGDALSKTRLNDREEYESQYPLHINSLRAIVEKHAAVLFGEVPDSPAPLVKTVVRPKKRFDGKDVDETTKTLAMICENVINEVWTRSDGRAMQLENGMYSQFLGGSVFQCKFRPDRQDLSIPLVISNPRPDHFLPEWSNDDYWSLLRGTTMYVIPAPTAKLQYGIGDGSPGETAVYIRTETATTISEKVEGQTIDFMGKATAQGAMQHNFGFVPAVYIPHKRVGSKYGVGHVEDVAALLKEYNAVFAALDTAALNTVDRETFVSNVPGTTLNFLTSPVTNRKFTSLGTTPPASGSKDAPKAWQEDVPMVSPSMSETRDRLWQQMLRDTNLSGIPFGEDEGSQRSGQTLALRMWPILSHTRAERTHWNDGLTRFGWYILKMLRQIMKDNEALAEKMRTLGINIPDNAEELLDISTEWSPQIPQDRAQLVLETTQLVQSEIRSKREAVTKLGDVKDIEAELAEIQKDQKLAADLAGQQNQPFGNNGASKPKPNGTLQSESTASASSSVN